MQLCECTSCHVDGIFVSAQIYSLLRCPLIVGRNTIIHWEMSLLIEHENILGTPISILIKLV